MPESARYKPYPLSASLRSEANIASWQCRQLLWLSWLVLTLFCCHTDTEGQMNFNRGAAMCYDGLGKPIVAMTSVTPSGESNILPVLKSGAYALI